MKFFTKNASALNENKIRDKKSYNFLRFRNKSYHYERSGTYKQAHKFNALIILIRKNAIKSIKKTHKLN